MQTIIENLPTIIPIVSVVILTISQIILTLQGKTKSVEQLEIAKQKQLNKLIAHNKKTEKKYIKELKQIKELKGETEKNDTSIKEI